MSATIVELQVENVKRLKAVQIVPKGNTVPISGRNDQGKSSVLDSIDYAFRGEKAICEEPIRQGEKRARVFIKLSEELESVCTIERRFTPSGTVLEIRNADGVPQKTPQALLDAIIAKMSFDPLSFVRMKAMEQMELLRKLVGLDFTEINAARKAAFDERTIRNREVESAKARLAGYPFNAVLPKEPISVMDLAKKLSSAQAHNDGNKQRRLAFERQQRDARALVADEKQLADDITELQRQLESKKQQLEIKKRARLQSEEEVLRLELELKDLADVDETAVRREIENVQRTNAEIEANRLHLKARDELDALESIVRGLNAKIQECDESKAAQIEFAEFPMPGLSFDEQRGVLLNGVPFSQGSQAKQLQAAVAIGLALNPKVRVILIRDGSLLDEQSLAMISEIAAKSAAQIWLEVIRSTDPSAIVIENGEVKA